MSHKQKRKQVWRDRHFNDPFVKQAFQEKQRSRAVFKLKQIQEKDKILSPGMTVVDLGAAPGSWSQSACQEVGDGQVLAIDLLPMEAIEGVTFLQGDFMDDDIYEKLKSCCPKRGIDVILSDMAPNLSGHKSVDSDRMFALAEAVLEFAGQVLILRGSLLIKVFQGEGFDAYIQTLRRRFDQVLVRKPEASRAQSREVYLLGKGFVGKDNS